MSGGLKVELELDDGSFTTGMIRAGESVTKFQAGVGRTITSIKELEGTSRSFLGTLRDVTVVLGQAHAAMGMIESVSTSWVHKIIDVNAEFERMVTIMKTLSTAQDPLKEATENVTKLRDMAKDAPFSLNAIHQAFVRLNAAGLDPMAGGMKALMDAVAAFGGGDSELDRAALAFQEMAGKGVVQMKELRNQLLMAIPNAAKLMARAVGESYGEMMSDIHTGTVDAKSSIAALNLEFERAFGGAAQRQMETFNGQIGRMAILIQDIAITNVGKPFLADGLPNTNGFFGAVKKQAQDFNEFLMSGTAKGLGNMLGEDLTKIVHAFREAINIAIEFKSEILAAGEGLAYAFAAQAVVGILNGIAGSIENVGTKLVLMRAQWGAAFQSISSTSPEAALQRRVAAQNQEQRAKILADAATEKAAASAIIAEKMRNLANTQPSALPRTETQQLKLESAALDAEEKVRNETLRASIILLNTKAEAEARVVAARAIAADLHEKAFEMATRPGKPVEPAIQNRANMAALRADEVANREIIKAESAALQEQASAWDRVAVAQAIATEKRREANSLPSAAIRNADEQAALNLAAVRAESAARKDIAMSEAAVIEATSAKGKTAALALEESTTIFGRVGAKATAFLPLLLASAGSLLTVLPALAIGIGFVADYFDLFGTHAKDAWENLDRFGASSLKAAHLGDAFLDAKQNQITALERQQATLDGLQKEHENSVNGFHLKLPGSLSESQMRGATGVGYDDGSVAKQIAAAKEELAGLKTKAAGYYEEGSANDALAAAEKQQKVVDNAFQVMQRDYNLASDNAAKEFADKLKETAAAHRSVSLLTADYQQEVKKRALDLYDQEIAKILEIKAAKDDAAKSGSDADQRAAAAYDLKAEAQLKTLRDAREQEAQQHMGLELNAKIPNDVKSLENASKEIEKLRADIDGATAGINGQDAAAEQLFETWLRLAKAGDAHVQAVREELDLMKQLKTEADDLNKIKIGGEKLDKAYRDAIQKEKEDLFKAQHDGEKMSPADEIAAKRAAGFFDGYGGTSPEQQRMTALRISTQQARVEAERLGTSLQNAIGSPLTSVMDMVVEKFTQIANVMGLIADKAISLSAAPREWGWKDTNTVSTTTSTQFDGMDHNSDQGKYYADVATGITKMAADLQVNAKDIATIISFESHFQENAKGPGGHTGLIQMGREEQAQFGYTPGVSTLNEQFAAAEAYFKARGVQPGDDLKQLYSIVNAGGRNRFGASDTAKGGTPGTVGDKVDYQMGPHQAAAENLLKNFGGSTNKYDDSAMAAKDQTLRETQAQVEAAKASAELRKQIKEYNDNAVKKLVIADGDGGKAMAKITDFIKNSPADGVDSKGRNFSNDMNDPHWAALIAAAKRSDAADAAAAAQKKAVTAADSSQKSVDDKLSAAADATANDLIKLSPGMKGASDALLKFKQSLDKNYAATVDAQPDGADSPKAKAVLAAEPDQLAAFRNSEIVADAVAAQKKTETFKSSLMTQDLAAQDNLAKTIARYNRELAEFTGTEEQKAIIAKQFASEIAAQRAEIASKTPLGKEMQQWGDLTKNLETGLTGWLNSSVDTLTQLITTGHANWKQLATTIMSDLTKMALKAAFSGLFGGLMGGGGGGSKKGAPMSLAKGGGGGGLFGIFHSGGIIGDMAPMHRMISSSVFAGASRFHEGGVIGADEVPIIAQKGEGVFTSAQMAAMGKGSSGGHQIAIHNNVTVNASGGTSEANADLAKQVGAQVEKLARATIVEELRNQMRPGNMLAA